jgi:hypothetical protein
METTETSNKKPIYKKWWAWVGAIVLLGLIIQLTASKETKQQWAKDAAAKQAAVDSTKARRITLAKYNMIQVGITRDQVDAIISPIDTTPDGESTLSVEDIQKLREDSDALFSIIYYAVNSVSGTGDGASYAKITYQGHTTSRVVDKTQFGLE